MPAIDQLKSILKEEVRKYAGSGRGARLRLYPILDDERSHYSVVAVDEPRGKYLKHEIHVVFARIQDDHIIVEVDNTDKPLVDALLQQGIPRDKIILTYAGEPLPDAVPSAGD